MDYLREWLTLLLLYFFNMTDSTLTFGLLLYTICSKTITELGINVQDFHSHWNYTKNVLHKWKRTKKCFELNSWSTSLFPATVKKTFCVFEASPVSLVCFLPLRRLSWFDGSGMGFSLDYPTIGLHAISRDVSAYPQEHLYVMVNGKLGGERDTKSKMGVIVVERIQSNSNQHRLNNNIHLQSLQGTH